MSVAREEQHRLEQLVFQTRHEQGVQALRTLLHKRREVLGKLWMNAEGDELVRMQGAAQEVEAMIKYIDKEPSIKQLEA